MVQIDEARLKELQEVFGPEDLAMVVEAFLEEVRQALATVADMVGSGPTALREAQLHYLVGSARNMGVVAFADLCKCYQLSQDVFTQQDYETLVKAFRQASASLDRRLRETNSAA